MTIDCKAIKGKGTVRQIRENGLLSTLSEIEVE